MIKIAITDDHPMVIKGIKNMLLKSTEIEIIGEYFNGSELMEGLKKRQPDVLLLDIQMPGTPGDELAQIITKVYPEVKIIALTGFDTPFFIRSMIQNGCKGYLLKNTTQNKLEIAIKNVNQGEMFIDEELKDKLLNTMFKLEKTKSVSGPDLTRRESEVLKLIVNEFTSQEIADQLFLSPRTVEKYRLQLLQKLKVKNTAGLVKIAMELNLLKNEED